VGLPYLSTVVKYDLSTDSWTSRADMPTARNFFGAANVNGKIYAIGGAPTPTAGTVVEEYDPVANSWTTKAPMPTSRYAVAAAPVNGKIYVMGGWGPIATVEEYNPGTDSWTTKAPMPTARDCLGAAAVNGKIYAIGGSYMGTPLSTVEEYDPVKDTWMVKAGIPTARERFGIAVVNGKIYVMGGNAQIDTVEEYDPEADVWETMTPMPTRRNCLAGEVVDGKIYAIGGALGGSIAAVEQGYIVPPPFVLRAKRGRIAIAPNRLDPAGTGRQFMIAVKGEGGREVTLSVCDVAGRIRREIRLILDAKGDVRTDYDGKDSTGSYLTPGLYWIVARGGGVDDKKGFAVVSGR